MLSRYLSYPIGFIAAVLIGIAIFQDLTFLALLGSFLIIVVIGIYFFSDQIDWWWYQKHPPRVEARMRELFAQRLSFYQQLSPEDKQKFETRVELYVEANEFIPNGWQSIPYDIQCWVASCPVMLTFGRDDYLLSEFERVVIYPHSFPSPQFPNQLHASEIYQEDGVLLFSSEKLLPGIMQSRAYYNIGLHEYAKVFQLMYPDYDYPDELDWEIFAQIAGYDQKKLLEYLGMQNISAWSVLVNLFFAFPEEMLQKMPQAYQKVKMVLNY
ncbi:MAG: zinc-dependent peptidase [Bacteroidia bacterium]|nr:zinc-dependent peptidase [Bacteroidia bacterium]